MIERRRERRGATVEDTKEKRSDGEERERQNNVDSLFYRFCRIDSDQRREDLSNESEKRFRARERVFFELPQQRSRRLR